MFPLLVSTNIRLCFCSLRYLEWTLPTGEQGIALLDHEKETARPVPAVRGLWTKCQAGRSLHRAPPCSPASTGWLLTHQPFLKTTFKWPKQSCLLNKFVMKRKPLPRKNVIWALSRCVTQLASAAISSDIRPPGTSPNYDNDSKTVAEARFCTCRNTVVGGFFVVVFCYNYIFKIKFCSSDNLS